MKKLVAGLLTGMMVFGSCFTLFGCGQNETPDNSGGDNGENNPPAEVTSSVYTHKTVVSHQVSYSDLPDCMYQFANMYTTNLNTDAEVTLYSDGTYELAKKIQHTGRKINTVYTFKGTYTQSGQEVTLSAATYATQSEDWGLLASTFGEAKSSTSDQDASLLNFFPGSYLTTVIENKPQKITLGTDGTCTFLMDTCAHTFHNKTTLICSNCGFYVPHDVVSGECTKCELETPYEYSSVPEEYKVALTGRSREDLDKGWSDDESVKVDSNGILDKITYMTKDYTKNNEPDFEKTMYVWKPTDYDASKKYDVVYLCHGATDDEKYWFFGPKLANYGEYTQDICMEGDLCYTVSVLDHLHQDGIIGDVIVVTPTIYYGEASGANVFYKELRNDIIPLIETMYPTYANCYGEETVSEAAMIASRNHRAMAGLSMGSMTTWSSGIVHCTDIISYFGCFHGGNFSSGGAFATTVKEALTGEFKDYKINYLYNGNGTWDNVAHDSHVALYKALIADGTLTEGVNTFLVDKSKKAHWYSGWIVDFYNCMKNDFFKHTTNAD